MRKSAMFLSTMVLTSMLFACGDEKAGEPKKEDVQTAAASDAETNTFTDALGNEVVVPKEVKNVVTLSPESLMLLAELGVKVAGTVDSQMQLPVEDGVTKVGGINDVNMEQVIALSPDLVIGTPHFHAKLLPSMAQNNIPMAIMQMVTFEDVKAVARTYGEIFNISESVEEKIAAAQEKVDAAVAKAKNVSDKKAIVLNVTPGGISVQKSGTTTLDVTQLLGLKNLGEELPDLPESVGSAPFSMENLVEMQPDYIFITVHGASEAGTAIIESQLQSDAAWKSLNAVKNNQTHVLPSHLFLTNPGLRYDETVQYMVDVISK